MEGMSGEIEKALGDAGSAGSSSFGSKFSSGLKIAGAAAGAAVGMAFCALTDTSPSKKMSIRKDANKTLKAANSLWDDIKSLMM